MAGLLVVALAVRVGVALATPDYRPVADAASYDRIAQGLATSGDFGAPRQRYVEIGRPPGYPFFLAGVYGLTGQSLKEAPPDSSVVLSRWEAARLAQALVGMLVVGLIGLIGWQLWGRRVGLLALGLAALYAPLAFISESMLTEGQFVALELAAVACVLAARRSSHPLRWLWGAGVLAGVAALTHDQGLVLALPLALGARGGLRRRWRAAWRPVVVVAALVLTVMPWTIRNAVVSGAFVPVTAHGGTTLAGTFNNVSRHPETGGTAIWVPPWLVPALAPIHRAYPAGPARDDAYARAALDYMGRHPGYVAEAVGIHTLRMVGIEIGAPQRDFPMSAGSRLSYSDVGVYWLWALGLLAVIGLFTRAGRRTPRWVWLTPLILWAAAVVFNGGVRFRAPLDPFVVLAAALAADAGMRLMATRVAASRTPRPAHIG